MTPGDETPGTEQQPKLPRAPRRKLRKLTPAEWARVRLYYETSDPPIGLRGLAKHFNLSESTVTKRGVDEHWQHKRNLTLEARTRLEQETAGALQIELKAAAQEVAAHVRDQLQPWIEKQKTAQIRRAVKRSRRAQKRLDKVSEGYQVYDSRKSLVVDMECSPKDEAYIATAEEKYDTLIRRNLGMSDGIGVGGALNLSILTNQAAVQVVSK